MTLELISESACFGGQLSYYRHDSKTCNSEMKFAVYQPPQAKYKPVPILYYLSGLTCTEENFMIKSGAQRYAAESGLMLVAPDTSPRNTGIPGEDDDWDFGTGAGFYVDAINDRWKPYYQMYSYVVKELPELIHKNFPVQAEKQGIFGHSMGGHGALICALKNPQQYQSVSAFAPIAAPMRCPWGQKAFRNYLGENQANWRSYDASELVIETQHPNRILIDQGTADSFLSQGQLLPEVFQAACDRAKQSLTLRMQAGYDHSYYFISTFMADHIRHHALFLTDDD